MTRFFGEPAGHAGRRHQDCRLLRIAHDQRGRRVGGPWLPDRRARHSMPPLSGASGDRVTTYAILHGPGRRSKTYPSSFDRRRGRRHRAHVRYGHRPAGGRRDPEPAGGPYPDAVTARVGANAGFFISNVHTAGLNRHRVRRLTTSLVCRRTPRLYGGRLSCRSPCPVRISPRGQRRIVRRRHLAGHGDADRRARPCLAPCDGRRHARPARLLCRRRLHGASSSPPLTHVVQRAASSLAFSRTPLQSTFGQTVTLRRASPRLLASRRAW